VTSFERYVRRIFLGTLSLILVVAGVFLLTGLKVWARGVILGGAASLVGLVIMARDVRRQGAAAAGKVVGPGYGSYALRMSILAAALVYAATSARIALWATIPAIFAAQIVMTLGEVLESREQEPS
jgi:hypothetical protein